MTKIGTKVLADDEASMLHTIAGYLNLSSGQPDAAFQKNLNRFFGQFDGKNAWNELRTRLVHYLHQVQKTSTAFADNTQALSVVMLVFDELYPAYRRHHADLLFHLSDEDFQQPFFLARLFEAALSQMPPWEEHERIVSGALDQLNDFLGYRPLAVLEDGRQSQPYSHERFRPIPLYIRGAGVAVGPYHDLIDKTLELLRATPPDILLSAHFNIDHVDELALDVRAHDHEHPANKRTNYMFGEWDPHLIDTKGQYRRFVVRKIILDSLKDWSEHTIPQRSRKESLYDTSAVLCGTILMASAISGSGPDTHDSNVTLTSLLPRVAQQRDMFYDRLLQEARGARAKRLARESRKTQQPFGHVRQALNLYLARYGACQVQRRHLARLYAQMGDAEAGRMQASVIPSLSARFECEIRWRVTSAHWYLSHSELAQTVTLLEELETLFHRGIECGALVDPWNVLGFQGNFPLFTSREDSIPDPRIETLFSIVDDIFGVYSRALGEAAVEGDEATAERISEGFRKLAEYWDQFATTAIEDLPHVSGEESWQSARSVAAALSDWRAAGESAGDISFWREHVEDFESSKSYALVVEALLAKQDAVAAMGLLMQWLSQADQVGLGSGSHSACVLLIRWLKQVSEQAAAKSGEQPCGLWKTICRLFDYLEVNAEAYWSVPTLEGITEGNAPAAGEDWLDESESPAAPDLLDADSGDLDDDLDGNYENPLYRAAYEDVVFQDSAMDGHVGDVHDGSSFGENSEIELIARRLDPQLRFLATVAQLWEMSGAILIPHLAGDRVKEKAEDLPEPDAQATVVDNWLTRLRKDQQSLLQLLVALWEYEIPLPSGDHDANVEYDFHLQTKFYLVHNVISALVKYRGAERCLLCCLPEGRDRDPMGRVDRNLVQLYQAIHKRDVAKTQSLLPETIRTFRGKPMLYVSLENGGHPKEILSSRTVQMDFRFLLTQLPRLGLLRETWQLLKVAHRLERTSRPGGIAITEFDGLFRIALRGTIECVVRNAEQWEPEPLPDDDLIDLIKKMTDHYTGLWRDYSRNMRLSTAEGLRGKSIWKDVKEFIVKYGADLFHARLLTLGNVRSILHNGVDWFLEYLKESADPLHPIPLIEDLESHAVDYDMVLDVLELVYETIVDEFDRFIEYNTTTTQSDYGEKFYWLLDFLRVEAAYERDAWNFVPSDIVHQVLTRHRKIRAAEMWEQAIEAEADGLAKSHLEALAALEKRSGIHLPSVRDRLNERFVKPLAVNRMLAHVPQSIEDLQQGRLDSEEFQTLRREVDEYLDQSSGAGIDIPNWLQSLEKEVSRSPGLDDGTELPDWPDEVPAVSLSQRDLHKQLQDWNRPLSKKKTQAKKRKQTPKKKKKKGSE